VFQNDSHFERLATSAHSEGGWGYSVGQPCHLEPTCLALLALSLERQRYQEPIARGWQALGANAVGDGGYRLARGREEAVWPTALVLFVQTALGRPQDEIERTASRLLSLRGRMPTDADCAEFVDIDYRIPGWPWADGNFSWVEPTSWACLALQSANYGGNERVTEGIRLLLDRMADEGGINYGNRHVFGRKTEPQVEPTAITLLALQHHHVHPRVPAALRYLYDQTLTSTDLDQLCWAKLVFDTCRPATQSAYTCAALDARILAAYDAREECCWLSPSLLREALIILALRTNQRNYFRLSESAANGDLRAAGRPTVRKVRAWPERLKGALRSAAVHGAGRLRPLAPRSFVHIASAGDYGANLVDVLRRQYDAFRGRVPLAGKRVVLKPNLVEYHRDKVINTHPDVVAAAIELCQREGAAEVIVAEGPGHCRNVEYLVSASGLGDVLRHYGVPFVDLNHDEPLKSLNLGRLTRLDYLYLARTVASAEVLISLPKLKTHHWAGATLSLKNLFGTLPGICYGWPKNELHWRGIDNSIVDIALTRTPELAIVDGIVGMEGDGPLNGTPKALGVLVMGDDPMAVDGTCCRLMGLDPERIGYLIMGQRKRLGLLPEHQIEQLGEAIAARAQPFATLPQFRTLALDRSA
jgi:uncharacterized protein (DUF362 family)